MTREFRIPVPSGCLYVTLRLDGPLTSSATWGSAVTENETFVDVRKVLYRHPLRQKLEWVWSRGRLGTESKLVNAGSDRGGVYRVPPDVAMTCAAIVAGTFLKARAKLVVH